MFSHESFTPIELEDFLDELQLLRTKPLWIMIAEGRIVRWFRGRVERIGNDQSIILISNFNEFVGFNPSKAKIQSQNQSYCNEIVQAYRLNFEDQILLISTSEIFETNIA